MATLLTTVKAPILGENGDHRIQFLPKFSRNSINTHPPRTLNEAFGSLTINLTDQNTLNTNRLDEAYSSVLELCSTSESLPQIKQIHTHVLKSNLVHDKMFLSTKLVFAYGKSGSISDAQKVFDEMPERSVFTWNALIGAYMTIDESLNAIELFSDMNLLGVSADASTYTSIFKACGEVGYRFYGVQLHGSVIKLGFLDNVYVRNSLIGMYAKWKDLDSATVVFESLSDKANVVSWNAIVSAFAASGKFGSSLRLFREMQKTKVIPNAYTFVAALGACDDLSYLVFGKELHAFLLKSDLYLDTFVANALLVMYIKCGKMKDAERIFDLMNEKDRVTWNSLISGFAQNGLYDESVDAFHRMQIAGQKPDKYSVISVIKTVDCMGSMSNGLEIHAFAIKNGMDSDLQVGNTLVDMYSKCRKMNYAESVFQRIRCRDDISWTTIIAGYAHNGCHSRALSSFREAQTNGVETDPVSIISILQSCSELMCGSVVKEIHGHVIRNGFSDTVLENTLVNTYGKCGWIDYASQVFELVNEKNVVSWTILMRCLLQNGFPDQVFDVYKSMIEAGTEPDPIAIVTLLSVVSDLSVLRKGKEIHGYVIRNGFSISSSLVDMYSSCGDLDSSFTVFRHIRPKDLVVFTSMINAYGMHGLGTESVRLFHQMVSENVIPDHVTFLAILYACSHSSLITEGKLFFKSMVNDYGLDPWPEHYTCFVDLLGRGNELEEAFDFVKNMKMTANVEIWRSLLGACKIHSNVELGDFAARKLLEFDSGNTKNTKNSILVSNFYASCGRWNDLDDLRTEMKQKGLKKDPGCSWIETGNKIHVFTVRDKSHPESDEIYEKLAQINDIIKRKRGYIERKEKAEMVNGHSERLAIAYGLLKTAKGMPIRVTKNLRVCDDCHVFSKLVSESFEREIIVRDANRFHRFADGVCSCGDFW